jgi:hypothetical protein
VGRKYTNESYLSVSIELSKDNSKKQQEHNITKVKIPYFFTVSVWEKIGEYTNGEKKGKPIMATQDFISKEPFPKEWVIAETKPVEVIFTNECPKCKKEGRPRIDKKNTDGYANPKYTSKSEVYRLIYNHKQEDKKIKPCIVAKFDKENGIFTKTGKISKRIENYIFPNFLRKERFI